MVVRAKALPTSAHEALPLSFVVIPPETYQALNKAALRMGLPLSHLLEQALTEFLHRLEKK